MCSQTSEEGLVGEPDLGALPTEPLEREIGELAAHISAATCRWLGLVAEFDRREGWASWGCRSCVHWLSYRCGVSPPAARAQVRVARRLAELPELRAAFGRGELCYSRVRALVRVATPETEADLLEIARHATADQLERIVRAYRGVLEVELGADDPRHRGRYVSWQHDDDGSLLLRARLPAEEGARVLVALQAGRELLRNRDREGDSAETTQIGDSGAAERPMASNADALLLMADTLLRFGVAEASDAERYQVVVHVDAATLAGGQDGHSDGGGGYPGGDPGEGACELEDGRVLHPETARRLACDADLVRILERDGRSLSVGRKTRSIPPALRRALRSRDRCCRFPGCGRTRFLHAHHLKHWARGGRTELSNLVQLCGFHHRLLHEGGWTLQRRPGGGLRFRRPNGAALPPVPAQPPGERHELLQRNGRAGLRLDDLTGAPRVSFDRLNLPLVVDGLAERDPRLRE